MTVRIEKPAYNVREKLSELDFGHVPYEKMPAGSVIQVVRINSNTDTIVSSTNVWTALGATFATIYPKSSNSYLLYCCSVSAEHDAAETSNIHGFLKLFRSVNGDTFESLGQSLLFMNESLDVTGATTTSTMNYLDDHKKPAGSKIEYRMFYQRQNNTSAIHFNQALSTSDGVVGSYSQGYIMEILK